MRGGLAAAIVAAAITSGCSNGPRAGAGVTDVDGTFVGVVEGTDIRLALVTAGGRARAYVCGGPTTYAHVAQWLDGSLDGNASRVSLASDGWTLSGAPSADGYAGELRSRDGDVWRWGAARTRSALEGLYDVVDEGCRTGVVVARDVAGDPMAQGVWCNSGHRLEQVTPVKPFELQGDAILVEVPAVGKRLEAHRVVLGR